MCITGIDEIRRHGIGFVLIEPAAESFESDFTNHVHSIQVLIQFPLPPKNLLMK